MTFKELIIDEYEKRRLQNPRYSLRTFSQEIGVNPATLSMYFAGKRDFGKKIRKRILENLAFPPREIEKLIVDDQEVSEGLLLDNKLHFLYAHPIYFSIISLIDTHDFKNDVHWIAKRLKETPSEVKEALGILKELNLVQLKGGRLTTVSANIASLDNIPNYSLRLRHQKNMEDAREAVAKVSLHRRYFSFETLAFDPADLPLVQKKINALLDDLILLSQRAKTKKEVYEFCMLYFPRTEELED